MYFEVIPTEVFRANSGALTYQSDQELLPGQIVLIPIGRRTVTGVVLRQIPKVDFPTKPITRVIHPCPIPKHLLASITWLSEYYLSSLPATANLMIPAGITARGAIGDADKKRLALSRGLSEATAENERRDPVTTGVANASPEKMLPSSYRLPLIDLNSAQKAALKALQQAPGATRLLRGVTGSGKTNICLL